MAYVYRHIRLDKNEPFYIGISNGIDYKRAYSKTYRNRHWNNIVNKTEYEVEILIDELTWEKACEKESEFIKLYGRKDLGTGTLINLTDGGEGAINVKISEQSRIKMSLGQRGNDKWKKRKPYKKPEIHFNKGRRKSDDAKNKLRLYFQLYGHPCIGKKHSEETKNKIRSKRQKKPVLQFTRSGDLVKEYESTKEVRKYGFNQSNVWKCCHNKARSHKNYIWKFK